MITLRQWHTYIGAFIAPSVLFFALTGIIQIFHLHEAHGGYQPYDLIAKLGRVHKDQEFNLPPRRNRPPRPSSAEDRGATPPAAGSSVATMATGAEPAAPDHGDDHQSGERQSMVKVYLLKWVFVFVGLGLFATTVMGVWMGMLMSRRRKPIVALLVIGTLLPIALIVI